MRIVQLNLAADPALRHPDQLLDTYHTLTGWSDALTNAGASVRVIQRYPTDATVRRAGTEYEFVEDGPAGTPAPWAVFRRVAAAVVRSSPDVIHVNGLMFPGMVRRARRLVGPSRVIVLQDHSGIVPPTAPWPLGALLRARWRSAFRDADACSFTASELAERWRPVGLPREMRLLALPEASTRMAATSHEEALRLTHLRGSPALLWVGRLDANKDPGTVLSAMEHFRHSIPTAHLTMVIPRDEGEEVRQRLATSIGLRERVTLVGPIAHREMANYYSAADIFVSSSHHEGSGYALIEAMACGLVPCVTDIPAFRALVGGCGALWRTGDADACAAALRDLSTRDLDVDREKVRRRFDGHLTWDAIGRQTFAAYADLLATRRAVPL